MELVGAPGTRESRKIWFASSAAAVIANLRKRRASTAADDHGAISVWDDLDGNYRCEAYRHCTTVDSQIFTSYAQVRKWWATWRKKIGERA